MKYYAASKEDSLQDLNVDATTGLNEAEVTSRRERYGKNALREKKKKTLLQRYIAQFKDVMVIILIIAAAVSFFLALNGEDKTEYLESIIILAIVILNATLGVVQESKAEKALDDLKKLSHTQSRVRRNGEEMLIDSEDLVPGDILLLEAGDLIPADGRLLESHSYRADESSLTGESLPSEKDDELVLGDDTALGDRHNMIFSGSPTVYGRGVAVVTAIGMDTEIGHIAGLLDQENGAKTPLQYKLAKIGKIFGFAAIGICAVIFALGLLYKLDPLTIFMTAVSLAVAAIPEGLVAIVAVILSMGVTRMVKRNAIVKTLPAVETLGSASVICSDKTGTLTQNKMTLMKIWAGGEISDLDNLDDREKAMLLYASLACDADVQLVDGERREIGDPTETAILNAALDHNMAKQELTETYPRLGEIPFDSDRKLMTSINRIDGEIIAVVKGATDVLLSRCHHSQNDDILAVNAALGDQALRILGVAYKKLEQVPSDPTSEEIENDLTFMGLLGMIDPPREEAKEAVSLCVEAGIRPIMITGDHVATASAIGRELGIYREGDKAISGLELARLDEADYERTIDEYSVYARVSPQDKIRIVKAWQARGDVVAMTGDGVNDAPALKAADIGCAMGITGTDVAKNASDIILTDDNFATIVDAVKEGRGIFNNIKRVIQFLLGTNIGEVLTVLVAMLFWKHPPLLALQILWINLVTDALPAFALGFEPIHNDVMRRRPRPKEESIFAAALGLKIVLQGIMFAVLTLVGFVIGYTATGQPSGGQTMAFLVLTMSQLFHAFNVRVDGSIFREGIAGNPMMLLAVAVSFLLVAVIAFVPFLAEIFSLMFLPVNLYLIALVLAIIPIPIVEIGKWVGRMVSKRRERL